MDQKGRKSIMMRATQIHMKPGCNTFSGGLLEIDSIYIDGCTSPDFYKKETLYDYLVDHPGSICVNIYPFPELLPAISLRYEKYVRSEPNDTPLDNLLRLPRV